VYLQHFTKQKSSITYHFQFLSKCSSFLQLLQVRLGFLTENLWVWDMCNRFLDWLLLLPSNQQHTHTTVLRLSWLCPGQPRWARTRRNIHPFTPIVVIDHHLSASSIYYDPRHPLCSIYVPDSLFCCSTEITSSDPSLTLNPLLGTLSCSLTPHIHLTILISAHWSATSFSSLKGQVSLPCNTLFHTPLLYNLPLTMIYPYW